MHPAAFLVDGDEGGDGVERLPDGPAQGYQLRRVAAVDFEQDQAGELVFFDQQPFVVTKSFALATDQKQLADFLPQCLHHIT